jgi:hypothetical protein
MVLLPSSPSTPTGDEYWLVENRHRESSARNFDRDIPESGLAIWWVNETANTVSLVDARNNDVRPNTFTYSAHDSQVGALFKHNPSDSVGLHSIVTQVGGGIRLFRGVSPAGSQMWSSF